MSARLRWYVGTVSVAGGLVLGFLLTQLDLDRAREVAGAIGVFAAFTVVGELVSLANDMPILQGLRRDNLRLELGSSAMVLALAPVAVVVAERSLLLLPALVVPLGAVFLASKGEIRARAQQAVAEEAAELQRRL